MVSNIIQERLDRRTFHEDTDTLGLLGLEPWQYQTTTRLYHYCCDGTISIYQVDVLPQVYSFHSLYSLTICLDSRIGRCGATIISCPLIGVTTVEESLSYLQSLSPLSFY